MINIWFNLNFYVTYGVLGDSGSQLWRIITFSYFTATALFQVLSSLYWTVMKISPSQFHSPWPLISLIQSKLETELSISMVTLLKPRSEHDTSPLQVSVTSHCLRNEAPVCLPRSPTICALTPLTEFRIVGITKACFKSLTHTPVYAQTYTRTHKYRHIGAHILMHIYTSARKHMCKHTYTPYTHTYVHTYTHHIYICVCIGKQSLDLGQKDQRGGTFKMAEE